jgi:hypothetical protein
VITQPPGVGVTCGGEHSPAPRVDAEARDAPPELLDDGEEEVFS